MKTAEEWASMYFSDEKKLLPDLIKEAQEEVKKEIMAAIRSKVKLYDKSH